MKKYTSPELGISLFSCETIVTVSGSEYTEELTTWQAQNPNAQLTKANKEQLKTIVKFTF